MTSSQTQKVQGLDRSASYACARIAHDSEGELTALEAKIRWYDPSLLGESRYDDRVLATAKKIGDWACNAVKKVTDFIYACKRRIFQKEIAELKSRHVEILKKIKEDTSEEEVPSIALSVGLARDEDADEYQDSNCLTSCVETACASESGGNTAWEVTKKIAYVGAGGLAGAALGGTLLATAAGAGAVFTARWAYNRFWGSAQTPAPVIPSEPAALQVKVEPAEASAPVAQALSPLAAPALSLAEQIPEVVVVPAVVVAEAAPAGIDPLAAYEALPAGTEDSRRLIIAMLTKTANTGLFSLGGYKGWFEATERYIKDTKHPERQPHPLKQFEMILASASLRDSLKEMKGGLKWTGAMGSIGCRGNFVEALQDATLTPEAIGGFAQKIGLNGANAAEAGRLINAIKSAPRVSKQSFELFDQLYDLLSKNTLPKAIGVKPDPNADFDALFKTLVKGKGYGVN